MSVKLAATYPASVAKKLVACILIVSVCTLSAPAAPQVIVTAAVGTYQDARFAMLSSDYAGTFPNIFAAFVKRTSANRRSQISRIQIFPGPLNVKQGQETVLSAIAFDRDDQPLSGEAFEWTVIDVGRNRRPKRLIDSTFRARIPGSFLIRASACGQQAEIPAVVTAFRNPVPADAQVHSVSTRTGLRISQSNAGDALSDENKSEKKAGDEAIPQAELIPGDGWDSNNWSSIDNPGNQPGNPPGSPADDGAGSGNFQLSAPVVSLPGRGLDLALNLNYNSRVWNKSGSQMKSTSIMAIRPQVGRLASARSRSWVTAAAC